jgi:Putative peptidoglycan binding domain
LREIAAASDFDFVALEPRRSDKGAAGKGARPKSERSKKAAAAPPSRLAGLWRYRTPALGAALLTGLLAAVVVNALFLQHGRHPAPLFGATFKIAPPKPPVRPASFDALLNEDIPQGALKPVDPAQSAAFAAPMADEQATAAEAARTRPAPAPAAQRQSRDTIGALIADNGVVTADMRAARDARRAVRTQSRAVLSAQKALERLGMAVKADGDYGAATRRAVAAFQYKNHLPVTGELNAKTRHALAARSGMRVD